MTSRRSPRLRRTRAHAALAGVVAIVVGISLALAGDTARIAPRVTAADVLATASRHPLPGPSNMRPPVVGPDGRVSGAPGKAAAQATDAGVTARKTPPSAAEKKKAEKLRARAWAEQQEEQRATLAKARKRADGAPATVEEADRKALQRWQDAAADAGGAGTTGASGPTSLTQQRQLATTTEAGTSTLLAATATAPTATVTGTVTETGTGTPVIGACIDVRGDSPEGAGDIVSHTCTDSSGGYVLADLPAPASPYFYYLYVTDFAGGHVNTSSAAVVSPGGTTTKDFTMDPGGQVEFQISASDGSPAEGVCAGAFSLTSSGSDYQWVEGCSDASGRLLTTGLPAGDYGFYLWTNDGPWLPQFFDGAATEKEATLVSVAVGSVNAGLTATMQRGATVSGTVTAEDTGAPIEGACVSIDDTTGGGGYGYGCTDAAGHYTTSGVTSGTFSVRVDAPYPGSTYLGLDVDPVTLTTGDDRQGVDAVLPVGGAISGTVRGADTGAPVASVCLAVEGGPSFTQACTDATGHFALQGLETGTYDVLAHGSGAYADALVAGVSVTRGATEVRDVVVPVGGTIGGTVVDDTSGDPVVGLCVYVSGPDFDSACTDASGAYTIRGLERGDYTVMFDGAGDYLTQYYDGAASYDSGTPVHVELGGSATGIDAVLHHGSFVTGKVATAAGEPVDTCVSGVDPATGDEVGTACTDASGEYRLGPIPAGPLYVRAFGNGLLVDTWHPNTTDVAQAVAVDVPETSTATGVDITMVAGGTLSGTVTGSPVAPVDAWMEIYEADQPGYPFAYPDVAPDGTWQATGLPPGTYLLTFHASNGDDIWYEAAATADSATPVDLTAGGEVTGVDVAMTTYDGAISGRLTDAETGDAVEACVALFSPSNRYSLLFFECADANGDYRLSGVRPGQYIALVTDPNGVYVAQYVDGAASFDTADILLVRNGSELRGVDQQLTRGGRINATVVADDTGNPEGACISVYDTVSGEWVGTSQCTSDSGLTTGALPPGSYLLYVEALNNYASQWYDRAASMDGATRVDVVVDETTPIDVRLLPGTASLSGDVVDATDGTTPIENVCVTVYGPQWSSACTDVNGHYVIDGLTGGDYTVQFAPELGTPYVEQTLSNQRIPDGEATVLDTSLDQGGRFTVSILDDATGEPLAAGCLQVEGTTYDRVCGYDGSPIATHGYPAGDYVLRFEPDDSTHVAEYWQDAYAWADATVVTLSGTDADPIEARLGTGRAITGKTTDRVTGASIGSVCVSVYGRDTGFYDNECSGSSGVYRTKGLPADEYLVEFQNGSGRYVTQWYDDVPTQEQAAPVTVTADADTTGVDARMDLGGNIEGTITDEVTGDPLAGTCVTLVPVGASRTERSAGCTDSDGAYTSPSVLPGDYLVRVESTDTGHRTTYFESALTADGAKVVTVSPGTTVRADVAMIASTVNVAGTVTDAVSDDPVPGACVYLYRADDGSSAAYGTCADEAGHYAFAGIDPGDYVAAWTDGWAAHHTLWSGDAADFGSAAAVNLSTGTDALDAALTPIATAAGTVTDALTGAPLAEVCGYLYPQGSDQAAVGYCSGDTGRVIFQGMPAGTYVIAMADATGTHVTGWYGGATRAEAVPVAVTDTSVRIDLDVALSPIATLRVTPKDGAGAELADACMYVYAVGASSATAATCSPPGGGPLVLQQLPAGEYEVAVVDPTGVHRTTWLADAALREDASTVSVGEGAVVDEQVTLPTVPTLGVQVDDGSGGPVPDVCAYVYPDGSDTSVAAGCTGADGSISLQGFPEGSYLVAVADPSGQRATTWSGQAYLRESASAVQVGADVVTVDLTMPVVGAVSGRVEDEAGAPLEGVCVYADDADGNYSHVGSCTGADGNFVLSGLAPGGYRLGYYPPGEPSPTRFWNDGASSEVEAPLIDVQAGSTISATTRVIPAG